MPVSTAHYDEWFAAFACASGKVAARAVAFRLPLSLSGGWAATVQRAALVAEGRGWADIAADLRSRTVDDVRASHGSYCATCGIDHAAERGVTPDDAAYADLCAYAFGAPRAETRLYDVTPDGTPDPGTLVKGRPLGPHRTDRDVTVHATDPETGKPTKLLAYASFRQNACRGCRSTPKATREAYQTAGDVEGYRAHVRAWFDSDDANDAARAEKAAATLHKAEKAARKAAERIAQAKALADRAAPPPRVVKPRTVRRLRADTDAKGA